MGSGYNTFTLTELDSSTTITVPPGSYTKINLALKLQSLLIAGSVTLGHNWTYTCTYPAYTEPDDFRLTFTVSGNSGNQPSFTFTTLSPFRQLGFEASTTYTFSANTLKSANAINLSYVLRAFIKSNIVQNTQDSILEEILSVGSFAPQSIVYFQQYNFDMNSKQLSSVNNNSWNFTLVDSYNQEIDLNGISWSFTLVFFQRTTTHELHKSELIIQNEDRLFKIQQEQEKLKQQLNIQQQPTDIIKAVYGVKPYPDAVIDTFLEPTSKIIWSWKKRKKIKVFLI